MCEWCFGSLLKPTLRKPVSNSQSFPNLCAQGGVSWGVKDPWINIYTYRATCYSPPPWSLWFSCSSWLQFSEDPFYILGSLDVLAFWGRAVGRWGFHHSSPWKEWGEIRDAAVYQVLERLEEVHFNKNQEIHGYELLQYWKALHFQMGEIPLHWTMLKFVSRGSVLDHPIYWVKNCWLVFWNMNLFFHIIYWEFHHPNWWTPSFFRGVGQPPTRLLLTIINHIITINVNHILTVYYQPIVGWNHQPNPAVKIEPVILALPGQDF